MRLQAPNPAEFKDAKDAVCEIIADYGVTTDSTLTGELRKDETLRQYNAELVLEILNQLEEEDKIFWDDESEQWVSTLN